jgi:cellulose synthase/poly-beta-1,6-N-acetylglucosamine synthase-like glycosyltransferase
MGYSALKNSATFPTAAREGAGKIFNAIIISLIGGFVAGIFILLVPVISIIAYAAVIYAWILQLQGWALIAKSEAPM